MNLDDFSASPSGSLAPTIQGAMAFVPDPLPPKLVLEPVIATLTEAATRLGELSGVGRTLPNPYLLVRPFQRKEAVASSNIEGTVTSLSDLMLLEAGADERDRPPDTREVQNYVHALEHAIERLAQLPVCLRLIREIHTILLTGVRTHRGAEFSPGEFRADQNWIGGSLTQIERARFVPPPPNQVMPTLDALEKFIQSPPDPELPLLVRLALIHYQFETIHPFPDGNGRVGRLLIPLILCEQGGLSQPLLYMSTYFERNQDEYIDRLYEVSRSGDWLGWINFFLRGVSEQSIDTIVRARRLLDLQSAYHDRIPSNRASGNLHRLIDSVFEAPYFTIRAAGHHLNVTYAAARNNVEKLVAADILSEVQVRMRPKVFVAHEVFSIIHDDRILDESTSI